jgi:hypothetical protein
MHNFKPKNKRQLMAYCHKGLPAPKKFITTPSAGKIMLTVFWVVNGVVHLEFVPAGTIIISEHCVGMLQKLRAHIWGFCPDMQPDFLQHNNTRLHVITFQCYSQYYFSVYLHTIYTWQCLDTLLPKENVDVLKYIRSFSDWM